MTEHEYLKQAYLLAKKANPASIRPNPFVGAMVVCDNGKIIGEGYHQKAGEAHAEVIAIQNALHNGADLSKCTLYVTLEPCSHTGKTPPCTNLIFEHRIPHIVIGSLDPNPMVSGMEILEKNGVKVTKCILPEIISLNDVFNINQLKKRPKYILKSATTFNGKIADRNGKSQWISSESSRAFVHNEIRSNVDAILSTAATVIQDKSSLNIRAKDGTIRELNAIIIDKHLDLLKNDNIDLPILKKRNHSKLYIITEQNKIPNLPEYIELIKIDFAGGAINFNSLHTTLLNQNCCCVLVEAGAKLNTSMLENNCIDEIYSFICPSIITDSQAKNVFESANAQTLDNKINLQIIDFKKIEEDILIHYKVLD